MKQDLLSYYESELHFIREMAREFAQSPDYSKVAGRLQLTGDVCPDPHIERLIEAFALIAGRIRHKIDDEFPGVTEALLGILYPHYLRPIPSMAIAQLALDPGQGRISGGFPIKKETLLYTRTIAGAGIACRFRTCYPVTLWPLQVTSGEILSPAALPEGVATGDTVAAIRLGLKCQNGSTPASMGLDHLRFHLQGENDVPYNLYELIFNNTCSVVLRESGESSEGHEIRLPGSSLRPVGFEQDEGLVPYPAGSFLGYRLLQEYFCFPAKFLFFDLVGLKNQRLDTLGEGFEIFLLLNEFERSERLQVLEQRVRGDNFRLGCTPIVNLFERAAEPIRLSQTVTEYQIKPDLHSPLGLEVYSVERVISASYQEQVRTFEPFYSFRHNYTDEASDAFWYATRRPSTRKGDKGTEVYLSLVDLNFQPAQPPVETLSLQITCTNRDLAAQLPLGRDYGELFLESSPNIRVRCLNKPTESVRPPLGSGLQWRLISHMGLNYLSLVHNGGNALQEILKLYDFSDSPPLRNQIAGIVNITSQPHMARVMAAGGVVFSLGLRVGLEFDEDKYIGGGVFMIASVLERFLGLYSSINSFTQLTATTRQRRRPLRQWAPRAGEQILL